jgi:hypothetical protein
MDKYTPEEILYVKAMKGKEFFNDLSRLFNKYEVYQDDILGLKTIKIMIQLIKGSVQQKDSPIKKQCRLGIKTIDQISLNEFKKIQVMSVIVNKK